MVAEHSTPGSDKLYSGLNTKMYTQCTQTLEKPRKVDHVG